MRRLPPDQRKIPLTTIAARTRLDTDGVEFLLMRAFSLGLLDGTIDEVAGTVHVTRVAPRVLRPEELARLRGHLLAWIGKVDAAAAMLEAEGVTHVAAIA
jgi:26S proteasome regulatory subunit N9